MVAAAPATSSLGDAMPKPGSRGFVVLRGVVGTDCVCSHVLRGASTNQHRARRAKQEARARPLEVDSR